MIKDNYKYKVWLFGRALGEIVTEDNHIYKAIFDVKIKAIREIDYQLDGGIYHDEGGYDYDLSAIEPEYPDDYTIIDTQRIILNDGDSKIKLILVIYDLYNLTEGRVIDDDDD